MSTAYRSYSSIAAIAIACIIAGDQMASGQAPEQPAVKDTIFARKILMGAIDRNMDEVETMLAPGGKLESADAREHTDTISVMLMSFPHLFPPASNQWKPDVNRDPATDTFAAPELWSNFSDFYSRATAASKVALDASRATKLTDFKALVGELRNACNGCHAKYLKNE